MHGRGPQPQERPLSLLGLMPRRLRGSTLATVVAQIQLLVRDAIVSTPGPSTTGRECAMALLCGPGSLWESYDDMVSAAVGGGRH